jgi:short-subunit dehydrogenase
MGMRIAADFAAKGWKVGAAARRQERLDELAAKYPDSVVTMAIDVTAPDGVDRLHELIEKLGGMDTMFYAAGVGWNDPSLDAARTDVTMDTNVMGFTRFVDAAYHYFAKYATADRRGQIAAITSVGGTKGIGASAVYSASKRYQWTYLEALEQLARNQRLPIDITDIRPGFVDTPLLGNAASSYPLIMSVDHAAPRIERAIERRRHVTVVDWRWAFVVALWRLVPRPLWRRLNLAFK